MKKNLLNLCLMLSILLCGSLPVSATTTSNDANSDDIYYIETTITDEPSLQVSTASTNRITKTKTTKIKNSEGTVLWSVSITATFTYNGTTSSCISCTPHASASASSWSIKSYSSYKGTNSATATAVATHTYGITSKDFTKSVTISCDKNGNIS